MPTENEVVSSSRVIWPTLSEMLALSDEELATVDPVAMNLTIAKGIPSLSNLEIDDYVHLADDWAADLAARMPGLECEFAERPDDWRNDLAFFRLGLVSWYADMILGVAYREEHRGLKRVRYTDPSDLFINGIMDARRGTCGNLALLHVVLGRRIGLPVSLACVGSHFICRYDDGSATYNIEATDTGRGGFSSQTDEYFLAKHNLPAAAQSCGSDLRSVTSREMLGLFLGLRARHLENTDRLTEAEPDYLLARYLFPGNRQLYIAQNQVSVQCSMDLFEPSEKGHPVELALWLQDLIRLTPWKYSKSQQYQPPQEKSNGNHVDAVLQEAFLNGNDFI